MPERFVVVGASLAGASAAATLREEGFEGDVVLVGDEPSPPYERPPLSKEYLRGETSLEDAFVFPEAFYAERAIETRFGVRAERVDTVERTIALADGDRLPFDALVLATGARNRRLDVPGADLEGVHDLRTAADAGRIRAEAAPGRTAVVVGMGFIGAEVAASLRQLGVSVTVLEVFSVPLFRVLGVEVGSVFEEIHRDHGVTMRFGDTVRAFEGSSRVERVVTAGGATIDCDFVVVGVGVHPATELAEEAGLAVRDGVLVDERCRTSAPGVFAAGDVTRHRHPLFGEIRVEHWQNALKQGRAAARSMLGAAEPYAEVPWFWSDQYDHTVQYAGFHTEHDELVWRGEPASRRFAAFYLRGGRIAAAVGLDRPKDVRRAIPLIASRAPVDPDALRDEDVDLRKLVA